VLDKQDRGRVLAVLDWELSTLGHPVADLAYSCMPYHLPTDGDQTGLQALPEKLPAGFFPSRPLPIDIPLRNDKCMLHVPLTASLPFQNSELLAQIDAPWGLTIRMPAMSLLIR
jgi:hypothetical protein